jgi:hypothetical protein
MLALIAAHRVFRVTDGLLSRSLQSSTATICGCIEYGICTTCSYSTASVKHKIRRVILERMAWSPVEDCRVRIVWNKVAPARAATEAVWSEVQNCSGSYIHFSRGIPSPILRFSWRCKMSLVVWQSYANSMMSSCSLWASAATALHATKFILVSFKHDYFELCWFLLEEICGSSFVFLRIRTQLQLYC